MPSYSDPPAPTLQQLADLFEAATEAKAFRSKDGKRGKLEFSIDNEALAAIGGACYATGTQVLEALREALARLRYVDSVTEQYKDPDKKGATAADCQAFIANELKHVPSSYDLQSNMRRRMFNTTLQKLVELGMWRAAIDAERFEKARQAEKDRQENLRKMHENAKRQEERMREKAERDRRESAAGSDRNSQSRRQKEQSNPFDGVFNEDFAEAFRKQWDDRWRDETNRAFYGFDYSHYSGRSERTNDKPKARNKERAPWYQVLGVPVNADKATIKSAWRKLSSELHPDKPENRNDPEKLERLKDVNTAKDEGLRGLA